MTRRQSNNQWSGDIAAHPVPKNSECKNPLEEFSPRFFGIKSASSSLIISQRAKISTQSIIHLCWCKWRTATNGVLFLHDNAPAHRSLATQKELYWSLNLFSGSGPVGLPSVLWTENNWNFAIFHPTRRSMLPRRPGWTDNILNFFLSGLKKLEQRAR